MASANKQSVIICFISMMMLCASFVIPRTKVSPSISVLYSSAVGAIGSKLTDNALATEAVSKFYKNAAEVKITPTSGGVNNVVQYLTFPDGSKKILRVYNNGLNTKRVVFEHAVLAELGKQALSFEVPRMVPSLDGKTTHVTLSNGAQACIVEVIKGGLPKLSCVRDIGRASGELNTAIGKVVVPKELCPTPPYFELFKVHHAITADKFYKEINGPSFDGVRPFADKMVKEIREMEALIAKVTLPSVLIHGDLHYDNVLCLDGKVTGLLDFEFCSFDWRPMELAICLSKYAGEKDATGASTAMAYFVDFIDGFADKGVLTPQEIALVPELINLRILSNVVYFVGRALGGEDDISSLTTRIANYCGRVDWVKANSQKIKDLVAAKMSK